MSVRRTRAGRMYGDPQGEKFNWAVALGGRHGISFYVSDDLYQQILVLANEHGLSVGAFCRMCVEDWLEKDAAQ